MKAVVCSAYGEPEVLQLQEVVKPVPNKNELLVKIQATAVTTADCRLRGLKVPNGFSFLTRLAVGLFRPRNSIIGMEFSGEVIGLGSGVGLFNEGDRVFGTTGMKLGANAEYVCIAENKSIVKIPDSLDYKDAVSLIFGGLTTLHFLRKNITLHTDSKILINGASGAVGTAAVQISKYHDAEVTGICTKTNHQLIRSIGADNVIDYTKHDFTNNGIKYDVILDTVGNLSFSMCRNSLTKTGKIILINADLGTIFSSLFNDKLICGVAGDSKSVLNKLIELYESKQLKPVIDSIYPLQNIVEAHRYVDKGRKKGNVVLTVN